MLKLLKSSTKDTIIYSIGTFSSRLVSLILIPLYTSRFSLADYGIMGIAEITIQLLTAFVGIGLFNGLFRWYWDEDYKNVQKSIFYSILLLVILSGTVISVPFFIFSTSISDILFNSTNYAYLVKLVIVVGSLESLIIVTSTLLRLRQKSIFYSLLSLLKLSVSLILNIYFIVYQNKGITAVYESQIIACIIYLLAISGYTIKNIRIKFEYKIIKDIILFCLPLLLTAIAGISLSVADRFILKHLSSLDNVGIYTLGYKLSNTLRVFVITSVNLAISPIIYKIINQPGNKRFYSKIMTYYTFGLLFFVLFFSVFSKELIAVMSKNDDYNIAYKIVPLISYGLLFSMLRDVSLIGINIMKKTRITAITLFLIASISIMLNFILIPRFSFYGSAFSMILSNIFYFLVILYFAQKYYPIPYELKKVFLMIVISLGIYFGSLLIKTGINYLDYFLKILLILSFPFILYLFSFYEEIEKQRIGEFWNKWKNPLNWKKNLDAYFKKQ